MALSWINQVDSVYSHDPLKTENDGKVVIQRGAVEKKVAAEK